MTWLLMNIGCIECGVSSRIVGVFSDEHKAQALADQLSDTHHWREYGQNHFTVFPLPAVDAPIDAEYSRAVVQR